jgi:1,4-dihydroxy-2-naphthoate polyprenyltransferase
MIWGMHRSSVALHGWLGRLPALVRLGRPLFLVGGALMHAVGVLIALAGGADLNWPTLLWGQLAITSIQLMTHYSNEYFDLPADRANPHPTRWAGGSQILVGGTLRPAVAAVTAAIFGVVGLAAGLVLALAVDAGPLALPLILLALALALQYSAPPLVLHSRGLGEITEAAIVMGLTPLVGTYLQQGALALRPLLGVIPLVLLQVNMMLILNLPDEVGDRAAGKRTLVVRLGGERAVALHNGLLVATYLSLPLLLSAGMHPLVAAALLLPAPVALWQAWRLARGAWREPGRWNSLALWAIGLPVGSAAAVAAAYLLLALAR